MTVIEIKPDDPEHIAKQKDRLNKKYTNGLQKLTRKLKKRKRGSLLEHAFEIIRYEMFCKIDASIYNEMFEAMKSYESKSPD